MKLKCILGKHDYRDTNDGVKYIGSYIDEEVDILYDRFTVKQECRHCGKTKNGQVRLPRSISVDMGWKI